MSFKLNKNEEKEWHHWVVELGTAREDLQKAVDKYNIDMFDIRNPLLDAAAKYNQMIAEVVAWTEDIYSSYAGVYEEKSDKWKEGDRGQAANEWVDHWNDFNPMEVEPEVGDELDLDDLDDAAQMLAEIPIEAEMD